MANLQYGDIIQFPKDSDNIIEPTSIDNVIPIKYDSFDEVYTVCAQDDATHMMIVMSTNDTDKYIIIEIGKCDNLYLLADAIVD